VYRGYSIQGTVSHRDGLLYLLAERYGLQDPSQEGFRRLHFTQRQVQVQSLHWAIQEAAARKELLFCCYLEFANTFNSVDHAVLWLLLKELNVPVIDLLQSLFSGAYYQANIPMAGRQKWSSHGARSRATSRPLCGLDSYSMLCS
jgi:hypothetical protein